MLTIVTLFSFSFAASPPIQTDNVVRGFGSGSNDVPLATDGYGLPNGIGATTRGADHATVAINEDRDIAVAYHSSRPAITGAGGANIKQVELAYYEYQDIGGIETWVYLDTILLGSIDYSPVLGLNQTSVRCERPDVVAVRDKFFVVWTRRYEDSLAPLQYPNQSEGPAVIECAWVEKASPQQTYKIQTYPDYRDPANPSPGLGYILDSHIVGTGLRDLLTKECLGVADAVPLSDDNDEYKVAVVYPHQTDFSGGGDLAQV